MIPFAEAVCKMSDKSSGALGKIDDVPVKILTTLSMERCA